MATRSKPCSRASVRTASVRAADARFTARPPSASRRRRTRGSRLPRLDDQVASRETAAARLEIADVAHPPPVRSPAVLESDRGRQAFLDRVEALDVLLHLDGR